LKFLAQEVFERFFHAIFGHQKLFYLIHKDSSLRKTDLANKLSTPGKLFGKRFGIMIICHSFSNDFYEVFEREKSLKPKLFLPVFEILKNCVQFLLHPGLKKEKPGCNRNYT